MKINNNLFSQIIDALVEDGYIVITNALDPTLSSKLEHFAHNQNSYTKAKISRSATQHLDSTKRSDKTLWMDEDDSIQSEYLTFAKQLQEHLNRELYLGVKYYESHFAVYEKNDFYEKHVDAFKNSKNRVVTTVYYLNNDWSQEDGGELLIYNENNELITKVSPQSNTLVVFLSDKFPHEVLPSNKKRFSIAGWFRVEG